MTSKLQSDRLSGFVSEFLDVDEDQLVIGSVHAGSDQHRLAGGDATSVAVYMQVDQYLGAQ